MTTSKRTVANPAWRMANLEGCCGIHTVARLKAEYPRNADAQHNRYASKSNARPMFYGYSQDWRTWSLISIVTRLMDHPSRNSEGTTGAFAITADIAFGAVLDHMKEVKQAMYIMSDNMTNMGDVHTGPFSTKKFVEWLEANELGSIIASGPVTSSRTSRDIQAWFFKPHWPLCSSMISEQKKQLIDLIEELNSDERFNVKKREAQAKSARKGKAESLATGW